MVGMVWLVIETRRDEMASHYHTILKIKADKRVDDVEGEGLDDGRFFVHLKDGFDFGTDPYQVVRTKSFERAVDALKAVRSAKGSA
jgi:hypothetical protein